jgi:site-specific recombinase XerD
VSALHVTPVGPTLRAAAPIYERALKDKSYRRCPVGQDVGRFLRALRWADYADNTLTAYEETLSRLAVDHDDFTGVGEFCTPVGKEYLRDFLDRHWGACAPDTRRRHLAAVKSLFRWALEEGLIGWDPAASIKPPRTRGGGVERVAYGVGTLHRLVTRQESLRDQCALQLLCRMGLRKNELRVLTLGDIDLARNLLVVHGKGGKVAVMPLAIPSLARDLKLHLQERAPYTPDEYLLYPRSERRRPMDPASVHRWFKRCLDQAGLQPTIRTHEMRHSAADHLWRQEGDIVKAQQLLRHESIATTQAYLHPTREDLARALSRLDEGWG